MDYIELLGSGVVGSILTAIVQAIINRRKNAAEVKSQQLNNDDKNIDNQKKADELQELRIMKLNETINLLQRQIDLMLLSNVRYTTIIHELYSQTCSRDECHQRQYMPQNEFKERLIKKEEEK